MGRARVIGIENSPSAQTPVLFVSNHISQVDPALILSALPFRWRTKVAIAMLGEFLRDWRYPRPGQIVVRFGVPLCFAPEVTPAHITQALQTAVHDL